MTAYSIYSVRDSNLRIMVIATIDPVTGMVH